MKVRLAGFNVDLETLRKEAPGAADRLTPETFSAAYARISRSPKNITALRREAVRDVAKARRSNQAIIFEMGHHSVAEHAVFNFDIMGVSRLALEEIEQFRLVSFTEKSQRYVTLQGDHVIPEEIRDAESKQLLTTIVARQNGFYQEALARLQRHVFDRHRELARQPSQHRILEGWAKEDARYILPLATQGQVGMTINARNLEHLFRRFRLSRRREVQRLGRVIHDLVKSVAPSLILFAEPSAFEKRLPPLLEEHLAVAAAPPAPATTEAEPEIVHVSEQADELIVAAFMCRRLGLTLDAAHHRVSGMSPRQKEEFYRDLFREMAFFDSPPREFELAEVTFQAVVSAANFAQLKRHRMATLLVSDYQIELGNTLPDSVREVGLAGEFNTIIAAANLAYTRLRERHGTAADYVLTNSHRRRVLVKMNLREVYHFVRLRDDEHAQWDIRRLAGQVAGQVRERMPLAAMMLCGKSQFAATYRKIYGPTP